MVPNLLSTWSARGQFSEAERVRLASVLDEYLKCLERGEAVTPEEILAGHPEMADRLRGYLSGLAVIHRAVALEGGPSAMADCHGQELGDFLLLREIGRGGMGVVYEAEQVSLGRHVAVKVLPFSATVDEKQILRFKNEAQAAAQVAHPHIVPVYAIGHEHGIHYFAMQLIGGRSIAEFLNQRRGTQIEPAHLSHSAGGAVQPQQTRDHVSSVATIGIQAAEALHAAHEIGVVHRDIKPSNLLLDEKAKVWVTDFGVARCRSSQSLTETGHLLGTMPYMSPEQAMGQAALVDHRTDIYSLGVTLYELATLRHPFEGIPDVALSLESVRSGLRPPRHWNRAIPPDFETIVLKAMAEERDERYSTALELAQDLQRFLDGQPILARRPVWTARVGKWAMRHRRSVAAACGILTLAISSLIAMVVIVSAERSQKAQALEVASANHALAEKNFERAEANFRQTREVLDRFGARVNELLAGELPGTELVREKLLEEMLVYYRQFSQQAKKNPELQADLALTYVKVGELSEQLGSHYDAQRAYEDACQILQELIAAQAQRLSHERNLALCWNNLGQLLTKRGDTAAAQDHFQRALRIQSRLAAGAPAGSQHGSDLAATHNNLGLLLSQLGQKPQAAENFRAAIEIQESIFASGENSDVNRKHLAASYSNLSSLFLRSQPQVARQWVEKAMSLQLQLVKNNPRRREYQSDLALSYNHLGAILSNLKQFPDAERCFKDAITIQQRLAAAAPLVAVYQRDLSFSYNNLGLTQSSGGALAAAEKSFDQALQIQRELVERHPQDAGVLSGLGGVYNNLGVVQQTQQHWQDASEAFQQAAAAQRQAVALAPACKQYRDALSKHYYNHAQVLVHMGRPADAVQIVLQRRALWMNDAARLSRIADELAAICQQLEPGELRQKVAQEALATLREAKQSAGEVSRDDADRSSDVRASATAAKSPAAALPSGSQARTGFLSIEID
jgi:tetratricopeptide (TPR) repeat protein/tRNA A-37 threonylcarbamoyl transferase component Bud32